MARVVEIIIRGKDQISKSRGSLGGVNTAMLGLGAVGVGVDALAGVGTVLGKLVMDTAEMEPMQLMFESREEGRC